MNSKNRRTDYVDIMRGIAILFVILGHVKTGPIGSLKWFWYSSFHLQIFFFVTGLFFSDKGSFKEFFKHKLKTLVKPYVIYSIILYIYKVKAGLSHLRLKPWFMQTFVFLFHNNFLWFLPTLFLINLLLYFVVKTANTKRKENIVTAIFLIAPLLIANSKVRFIFGLDGVINAFIFAWSGYLMKKNRSLLTPVVNYLEKKNLNLIAFTAFTVLAASLTTYYPYGHIEFYCNSLGIVPLTYFVLFSCLCIAICVSKKICNHKNSYLYKFLSHLGENSFVFYVFHQEMIRALEPVFCGYAHNNFQMLIAQVLMIAFILLVIEGISQMMNYRKRRFV